MDDQSLEALFKQADKIGKKRYHKLTVQDFEDYRRFDYWRYINGDYECGTTQQSRDWVHENSELYCPICDRKFSTRGGKTIDHKLPRAQYPWLSLDFRNLWVICQHCNQEKSDMHWYEYEHYVFVHYPKLYSNVSFARPTVLLQTLKTEDASE
ncbi:hypothetical protein LEP3755_18020 [Leptolyngbya sp. NIES-3755]|nr:hypothetical protein LEP3755_18020 [Leptolyngbya sp. NIES-3755]